MGVGIDGWRADPLSLRGKKIWVAGGDGLVGSAVRARLQNEECRILTVPRAALDCRDQKAVRGFIQNEEPDIIVAAAAKVGGIQANLDAPAEFLYDNLMIASNIIHAAREAGVEKLLYLGSSCIYPKDAVNPISEGALLEGALEASNEGYALAKIAGIKLCETYRRQYGCDFISAMPCNLYGPGDRFDARHSHVIPALMMRMRAAKLAGEKILSVWGSGRPRREFLYAADLADALVFLLKRYSGVSPVNIGAGRDISIAELAVEIAAVVGYLGDFVFDTEKPDGAMRKLMDSGRLHKAGWQPQTSLQDGLALTYRWFLQNSALKNAA